MMQSQRKEMLNEDYRKMQRLWRKKQMTLLQKQNTSMTLCAL